MMDWLWMLAMGGVIIVLGARVFIGGPTISAEEARKLVADGAVLVDVRTPAEFAAGHIAEAVNIPVQELQGRLGELPSRERAVVLYCRSGARSGRAAELLRGAGYQQVHNLGAMSRW